MYKNKIADALPWYYFIPSDVNFLMHVDGGRDKEGISNRVADHEASRRTQFRLMFCSIGWNERMLSFYPYLFRAREHARKRVTSFDHETTMTNWGPLVGANAEGTWSDETVRDAS
jgi:hypothetical protein